ncbi:acyl-CoA synthetase (AMP-forming)/AMP-acid ligase II [Actinocorallia herbida]|uniref:Acyl-CoA synthetase (AMP-forming)/AMP-acid ligase II n=1 Tax=Actinocorallia herbida TaxID=58109 RepID=A0A3N1D303_9ACTN|nr:fatty acid--CoA ligase family protein [Actinocorallia herbida]ROO87915.1 acyl-CoA synthetase (AMP-forming)/AMP-acid ligase II [Actinocorallia herbida]
MSASITEAHWLPGQVAALDGTAPETPVLEFHESWTTWGDLAAIGAAVEAELVRLGLGRGARVGVVLENRPESVAVLRLTLSSERCLTSFNPLQPAERLSADVLRTEAPVVFASAEVWTLPGFAEAVATVGGAGFTLDGVKVAPVDLPDVPERGEPRSVAPGVAVELTTSGTTGTPKRIPLTYRQIESALGSADGHMAAGGGDRAPFTGGIGLLTTPMVHIGGLWSVLHALVQARRLSMLERFTVDGWRDMVRRHRPKVSGLPPAAIRAVLDAEVPAEELESLVAINAGAAPLRPELADAFQDRYGIAILIVYGATEFSGGVAGWSLRDHRTWWKDKKGSVGRPFPGVELRVVGDDGAALPAGEQGVLEIKTPQAGGDGDWIRTSDLARIDADGFLFLVGRADDVIIRGGFKVRPATVVEIMERHPAVAEAAVAPLADARLGQVPVVAFETTRGMETPAEDELRAWCRQGLMPYEVPTRFLPVEALPRSVSQKVDRAGLLALFHPEQP